MLGLKKKTTKDWVDLFYQINFIVIAINARNYRDNIFLSISPIPTSNCWPRLSQCRSSAPWCLVLLILNSRVGGGVSPNRWNRGQAAKIPVWLRLLLSLPLFYGSFSSHDFCFTVLLSRFNASSLRLSGSGHGFAIHRLWLGVSKRWDK